MRYGILSLLFSVLMLGACDTDGASEKARPELTPGRAVLLPGMEQTLRVEGLKGTDLIWSTDGGRIVPNGSTARFVAPQEGGNYRVSVTQRSSSKGIPLEALQRVAAPAAGKLVIEEASASELKGKRGSILFEVEADENLGAVARISLADGASDDLGEIEVQVSDGTRAVLNVAGLAIDGQGSLHAEEARVLHDLVTAGFFPDLALAALDLPCAGVDLSPQTLAALLFPWQLLQKYMTPDRKAHTLSLTRASACRYYTSLEEAPDSRPSPTLPLLANGQYVPFVVGYLPLDDKGEVSLPSQSQALTPPDQNVYGPGQAMCRGACGADCEENNCGEPREEWRCVKQNGQNTGEKELWRSYTCGEHPGCIEHDACFDNCNVVFGVESWDAAFCMRGCDIQAAMGYGADQGAEWAQGYGPFTHEKTYEYGQGDAIRDEAACPLTFSLIASPASGLAPHATVLKWTGAESDTGSERCRLDLGDGSDLVDIDPCPASGEYAHIYGVPSEMRQASGVYTASLTRIGAAQTATTEVQARFLFEATPTNGKAPLLTGFIWTGFALVDKPLTCTLDFGDGSAEQTIDDCANKPGLIHTYADRGVYQAKLTVRGEDRPVSKTLSIEVSSNDEPVKQDFASVSKWQLNYSIQNNSDHAWTELGGVSVNRTWKETEQGSLVLTRASVNGKVISLEGAGQVSSSIDFTKTRASQYFSEERWDKGQGTSTMRVRVALDAQRGMYDVYFSPGDFAVQYGGWRKNPDGSSESYGPSDEEMSVQPAPVTATGELTRTLPAQGLTITGSYTWDDYYAFESAHDPDFDVNEAWKKAHKSGTTQWTLMPLPN